VEKARDALTRAAESGYGWEIRETPIDPLTIIGERDDRPGPSYDHSLREKWLMDTDGEVVHEVTLDRWYNYPTTNKVKKKWIISNWSWILLDSRREWDWGPRDYGQGGEVILIAKPGMEWVASLRDKLEKLTSGEADV